jgi:pyrroline-5-carboxylate reductase
LSVTLKPKILFVGYGHLAKSLISRNFLNQFAIDSINSKSRIYSLNAKKGLKKLSSSYKYVFLLIRPNLFYQKGYDFNRYVDSKTIVVSCMAGVTINTIQEVLDTKNIIRIMPNVMAKQNASHTYVYVKTNKLINNFFKKILKSFGTFHVCSKEDEINIATAIYGSGPAFIAHIVNAFVAASKNISPNTKVNEKDIITLFQSVISINNSSQKLEEFVQSIASKKGTTQAGVNFLKSQNLKKIMYTTLHRAYKRAKEISIEKQGLK